jgi:hypothetical protein
MMKTTHNPVIASSTAPVAEGLPAGFPSGNQIAVADSRYVNRYYYDAASCTWYLVVEAQLIDGINNWLVRAVDVEDGRPIGQLKKHTHDLWADRFADRPFDVQKFLAGRLESTFDWFKATFCSHETDVAKVHKLYESYVYRLRFCSSFEAVVRLGLRQP